MRTPKHKRRRADSESAEDASTSGFLYVLEKIHAPALEEPWTANAIAEVQQGFPQVPWPVIVEGLLSAAQSLDPERLLLALRIPSHDGLDVTMRSAAITLSRNSLAEMYDLVLRQHHEDLGLTKKQLRRINTFHLANLTLIAAIRNTNLRATYGSALFGGGS